jgi:hypothetical protein
MATTFKTLTANDITNTRTVLHEAIPLTGTISSGTYADENIKTYSHGMFTSVFDYPYLSSSANHIFDLATGYSDNSGLSGTYGGDQESKKINIYTQMAQVLMGYDVNGAVQDFDMDGNLVTSPAGTNGSEGSGKMREVFFINFARLLGKDEIKKGSFELALVTGGLPSAFGASAPYYANGLADNGGTLGPVLTLGDYSATSSYFVNSPAGEYGLLYSGSREPNPGSAFGIVFYQAAIAVVSASVWGNPIGGGPWTGADPGQDGPSACGPFMTGLSPTGVGTVSGSWISLMTSSATLDQINNAQRNRIKNISFNNTVELNSTIYFCRVAHNEFNYSANPTYLNSSKIRVKNSTSDQPVSYITTVGLYSSDNELLAVAKLSEPLKKDPNTELTLRVRLDY